MAKFSGKNMKLKDGQKAVFGTNDESSIYWNADNAELTISTVVSGIDPTDPGHLVTRRYVDDNSVSNFIDLNDTPTTYSGQAYHLLRVNGDEDEIEFVSLSVHGSLQFSENPTFNGFMHVLGWHEQTDTAVSLSSGSPITPSKAGYNSHFIMDVSSVVGAPFTINVSGFVADDDTGATSSDSENITISGAAYYQTDKHFVDAPTISIVEGSKSCTLDIYKAAYWNYGEKDFTLTGCTLEWTPDQNNWDIDFKICHQLTNGSLSPIEHVTFSNHDTYPRAADDEPGRYHRTDYNEFIEGSAHEGIRVCTDQSGISNFYIELRYDSIGE